jgi:carbon-monoxide dehydrogenase small subunit
MTTVALLQEQPRPDEATIRHALEGNLCRCTGYQFIVNSVRSAAEKVAGGAAPVPYDGR